MNVETLFAAYGIRGLTVKHVPRDYGPPWQAQWQTPGGAKRTAWGRTLADAIRLALAKARK